MGMREVRTIRRAVNLTFKITNAKEQYAEVQMITRAITHAMNMLRILRISLRITEASHPYLWALLGISVTAEAFLVSQEFTPKEEYRSRSPP